MTRTHNSLRFGVHIGDRSFDQSVAVCQAAEAAGFTTASIGDRVLDPCFEAWTLASALGARTQKIILTFATLNIPFRNPALTAKMAGSLDTIMGGDRLELSLGAGGQPQQYTSYGLSYGDAGERFEGLRDAVNIIRGLWANDKFSYSGPVYQVEEASIGFRPDSESIPIWIGAMGPRMMRYTGRVADGWMKNRGWPESIEQLQGLVHQLETSAERAGRDPLGIRRVLNGGAAIGRENLRAPTSPRPGASPLSVNNLAGTSEEILETVEQYRNEGIDAFHLRFPEEGLLEQIQQFGEQVIAKVS